MRILHVVRQFWPSTGGMEQFVLELCKELFKAGHQSEILTLNRLFSNRSQTLAAQEVLQQSWGTLKIHRISAPGMTSLFWPRFGDFDFMAYDLIHYHCVDAMLPFLLPKIGLKPLVVTTHGGWFHTDRMLFLKNMLFVGVLPHYLKRAQKIAACSVADYLRFSPLFPNTELLPNGINWQGFECERQSINPYCLVHVAANRPSKRIDLLLSRFLELKQKYPQAELHLIGGGNWPGHIHPSLLNQAGLTVHGEVPHEQLKNLLVGAGFVVSASRYEGFGLAVAEAMAAGCIPILQDNEAYRAFVMDIPNQGRTGRLIDYSVPSSLLAAFEDLLTTQNLLEISHLCRKLTQVFDWEKVGKLYSDLYLKAT